MSEPINERQRTAIRHLLAVAKVAVMNFAIFAALALLVLVSDSTFWSKLLPNGTFRELAEFCAKNSCSVPPSQVSAAYLLQAIYGGMFIAGVWIRLQNKRKATFVAVAGMIILALQTIVQRFGFERGTVFANYVYDHSVYLMLPALLVLFFCTAMHIMLRSEKFERELALRHRSPV